MQLVVPGRAPIPMMSGSEPVRAFNPGWRAESLFTLLDPVWLLVLRHEGGDVACWYLESSGLLCAPPARTEAERAGWVARLEEIGLWLRHAQDTPIRVAVPEVVPAYLALPLAVRHELDALLGPVGLAALPAHSFRQEGPATPPLCFARVSESNGYLIGHPGAMVPLSAGPALAELLPGWRIASIETVFAPLLAVVLHHEEGHEATWFVGLDGVLVSHSIALLPPPWLRHVVRLAGALFSGLWDRFVLGLPDEDGSSGFAALPDAELATLIPLHLEASGQDGPTRVWTLDAPPPPGLAYVVPTSRGLVALDPARVTRSLVHGLHSEMDRLLREGRMMWPSPIDGALVESDGFAVLLDQNHFAYRFRQEPGGVVFHVVCTGTYFYNHALYFPAADLLVARTPELAAACRTHLAHGRAALLRHLVALRKALTAGASRPPDPVIQQFFGACAIHIGHYVWQDLAGLAYLLRRSGGHGRLPHLQIFSRDVIQAYFGPEERIFPLLDGRITRHAHGFDAHIAAFYGGNQRVIRYNAISVPAELGPAVLAAAAAAPEMADARLAADAARERGAPVILFGLRAGNRTLEDMEAFASELLRHLGRTFPGCTVVLDGLNDPDDRGDAVRPSIVPGSDLDQELALATRLSRIGTEAGVHVVNNINRSALRSVVWCSRADCFIAPLGAALAKYRWICNTPGLVLSSRWNLEHRADLHIYDAPAALEGSSEMLFNTVDEVHDTVPDTQAGIAEGRGNFVVDRAPVFDRLADLVRRHAVARGAGISRMS